MPLYISAPAGTPVEIGTTRNGESRTERIGAWGRAHDVALSPLYGGRVADLPFAAPGAVHQHDGTYALMVPATDTARDVTVVEGGRIKQFHQTEMFSKNGWAPADYYMLETDASGDLVIEPGENHRRIYVSKAPAAWTAASIAAAAGIAPNGVTGAWLLGHPAYGQSEASAVIPALATLIINAMQPANPNDRLRPSYWLLFERGYDYTDFTLPVHSGESPLHPRLIADYGSGSPVRIGYSPSGRQWPQNTVFRGVGFHGTPRGFENFLIADAGFDEEVKLDAADHGSGLTLYRTKTVDAHFAAPVNGAASWAISHDNRVSGIYVAGVRGTLLHSAFWDHCGWVDGYSTTTVDWAGGANPQPPSIYSHNIYTQYNCLDMTFRNILSMRSASVGAQMRCGGWQMQCAYIDNGVAANNAGQPAYGAPNDTGHWPLTLQSVVTSASYLRFPPGYGAGAVNWGIDHGVAPLPSAVDCIVLHEADPDNPAEIAAKQGPDGAFRSTNATHPPFFNNTTIWRWDEQGAHTDGLDAAVLNGRTIQRYAGEVLSLPLATIAGYAAHCRSLSPRQLQAEIDRLWRWFAGARAANAVLPVAVRTTPAALIFKPDERGEGFRSDNPLNWSSGDAPINGDSIDLHGNRMKWVTDTRLLSGCAFRGGKLEVSSGRLGVASHADAATVEVMNCGQYHAPATTGNYVARGGRLALTDTASVGIEASGQAEVILGPDCTIPAGKKLRIVGSMGKVGWDMPDGAAELLVEGVLEFHVTPVLEISSGTLTGWSFQLSDMRGATSGATGRWDSWRQTGSNVRARVRDIAGAPVEGEATVSAIRNHAGEEPAIRTGVVTDILPGEIGQLRLFRSGRWGLVAPGVTAGVILAAGSAVLIPGLAWLDPNKTYYLTGPGITVVDQGAVLPAGVSVVGGRLVLVV